MIKRTISVLEQIYRAVLVIMTALIVIVGIYQVIGRFFVFLHLSTSWTEESMRYIYIGIIMLGLATVTRADAFTTITVLSDAIEKRSRVGGMILYWFQSLMQIICFGMMFYYGLLLMASAGNRVSAVMRLPFNIIYAPIPIGSFLSTVISILKLIQNPTGNKPYTEDAEGGND